MGNLHRGIRNYSVSYVYSYKWGFLLSLGGMKMEEPKKGTRRRGEILEEAILQAAWEELGKVGYTHLTMESVATRAGTNKAVLYRRWANKSILVMAVLHRYLPKIPNEVPDTGDLRTDLYTYLHERTVPFKTIGIMQIIHGLMLEPLIWRNIVAAMPQIVQRRSENKLIAAMTAILKNAEKRGEIRLEKLTPRIISLPIDLLQCEVVTKQEISDEAITEIVDDIFMPLIRSKMNE